MNQEFIVAKIHGIDGLIGIDCLCQYDGIITIKRQILKTSFGNVTLYKQNTNTCARIQVVETVIIKPHAETFIKTTIEQPCIKTERVSVAEPTKFLLNKGCLIKKNKKLVNPKEEEVIVPIINLSQHAVKVNQNSSIGKLENVDHICNPEHKEPENVNSTFLPQHLEPLLQNASTKLTAEEKHRLEHLIIDYQDIFMLPDRNLGQTHTIEHEINTGSH